MKEAIANFVDLLEDILAVVIEFVIFICWFVLYPFYYVSIRVIEAARKRIKSRRDGER